MDRGFKKSVLSRLIMIMLKVVENIYDQNNPKVAIRHVYSDKDVKINFVEYIINDKPINGEPIYGEVGEIEEYYTGEEARNKYLSVVLNTYSNIFRYIAEVLSAGSEKKEEKMFRIIKRIVSEIEEEERRDKKILLSGHPINLLELELLEILSKTKKEV